MTPINPGELGQSAAEALAVVQRVPPAQGLSMRGVPFAAHDQVRVGFIGLGGRGLGVLRELLAVEGARVTALCDPVPAQVAKAQASVQQAGQPSPAICAEWQAVARRDDVDIVYLCTPWGQHAAQAVQVMESGKHAALEVPAAATVADCWRLVDTSERTRRHCVMLENCCYSYNEMLLCNLVRAGVLGTITHGEAAYIHELRDLLLKDDGTLNWRRQPTISSNGNFYPTHGLGPLARAMEIHRGDRFTRLVSMSSKSTALAEYRDAKLPLTDPRRAERYQAGDMNSTLIKTALGRTILLQYDIVTPRPYTRLNLLQGSKGTFADFPPRLALDGQDSHKWQTLDAFKEQYEHPLWRQQGELARQLGGHGGMDFIMNYRLVQCMREGLPPDIDVYDAAAWSAPGPLSVISVAWDSLALPFPDFTRGHWHA